MKRIKYFFKLVLFFQISIFSALSFALEFSDVVAKAMKIKVSEYHEIQAKIKSLVGFSSLSICNASLLNSSERKSYDQTLANFAELELMVYSYAMHYIFFASGNDVPKKIEEISADLQVLLTLRARRISSDAVFEDISFSAGMNNDDLLSFFAYFLLIIESGFDREPLLHFAQKYITGMVSRNSLAVNYPILKEARIFNLDYQKLLFSMADNNDGLLDIARFFLLDSINRTSNKFTQRAYEVFSKSGVSGFKQFTDLRSFLDYMEKASIHKVPHSLFSPGDPAVIEAVYASVNWFQNWGLVDPQQEILDRVNIVISPRYIKEMRNGRFHVCSYWNYGVYSFRNDSSANPYEFNRLEALLDNMKNNLGGKNNPFGVGEIVFYDEIPFDYVEKIQVGSSRKAWLQEVVKDFFEKQFPSQSVESIKIGSRTLDQVLKLIE